MLPILRIKTQKTKQKSKWCVSLRQWAILFSILVFVSVRKYCCLIDVYAFNCISDYYGYFYNL